MSNYAIYQPKNKAAEYASWACNFYVGCSNGCEYCYCKKGILAPVMGQDKPQLKKCFKDENHALAVFEKELKQNLSELQKHGLFFSFTTDPMLPETFQLTWYAMAKCCDHKIPVKILTKRTDWVTWQRLEIHTFEGCRDLKQHERKLIAFGFTLTGHDELEPGASTNAERIEAMRKLHEGGFKTFASIEPVIDFEASFQMIKQSAMWCNLFKIGLQSGKKYDELELKNFIARIEMRYDFFYITKWYFKDSLLKAAGITRAELPANCVDRDYNIFKDAN